MEPEEHPSTLEISVPREIAGSMEGRVIAGRPTGNLVAYVNTIQPDSVLKSWNVGLTKADALKLGLYLIRCALRKGDA